MANEKLKGCKSPGIDQILAVSIKAGSRTIHPENHKLINPIRSKEEVPQTWGKSLFYLPKRKKAKQTAVIIDPYQSYQLHIKINQQPCVKVNILTQWKLLGIIRVAFDVTGNLLIIYPAFVTYLTEME
jgi:hypothetical protein